MKDAARTGRFATTRAVPALGAGSASTGTVTVSVAANTPPGTYFLLSCADDTGAITESEETNNCLASSTTVQITAPDLAVTAVSDPPGSAPRGAASR